MSRHARSLIAVAFVLAVAGVAAANGVLTPSSSTVTSSGTVVAGPMFAQLSTTPTTVGPTTNGVPATVLAQGPSIGGPPTSTTTSPTASTGATGASIGVTIDQIVSFTRVVEAGTTALNVFTVPAGRLFVLTDALLTNPGAAAACGASITPSGPSTPTAIEAGTGVLCVPAQASLNLGLTTGMEFTGGQGVILGNVATPPGTGGALHFHLRGFLATLGV